MKIKDIMRTPVITIVESATIREAVALLSQAAVSGLPVVNSDNDLVGVVTEHDIIKRMLPTYEDLLASDEAILDAGLIEDRVYAIRDNPVCDIMSRNVVAIREDDTVLKAASTMILKNIKRLPVVSDRQPIGIVSRIDILHALMCETEQCP